MSKTTALESEINLLKEELESLKTLLRTEDEASETLPMPRPEKAVAIEIEVQHPETKSHVQKTANRRKRLDNARDTLHKKHVVPTLLEILRFVLSKTKHSET